MKLPKQQFNFRDQKMAGFTYLSVLITVVLSTESKKCGTNSFEKSIDSWDRIVGGHDAIKGYWPWQLSLSVSYARKFRHICGASLISNQWAITAAHCIDKANEPPFKYQIRIGEHDFRINENSEITVDVDKVIEHEGFSMAHGRDDIALLKLIKPIVNLNMSDYINTVCLPENLDPNFEGQTCVATGWGYLQYMGKAADILQEVAVPVINQEECARVFEDSRPVTDGMICTGVKEGNKGACHGDSGGPLVCKVNDQWHLVGITSWGAFDGCSTPEHYPTVFTRVTHYLPWIREQLAKN